MNDVASTIRGDTALRRVVDVVGSATALLLLSPVFLVTAVAIKLEAPGPVFFSQPRAGKNGRLFRILKFRSMIVGASRTGARVAGKRDPRITRVGAVLRATKLDEFPQFWNVLRGDLTLVGPRAEDLEIVRYYTPQERLTLLVRPGLTCPGQLYFTTSQSADLDGAEDPEKFYVEHQLHEKLALDLEYLTRRSLWVDIGIVVRTVRVMLAGLRHRA